MINRINTKIKQNELGTTDNRLGLNKLGLAEVRFQTRN